MMRERFGVGGVGCGVLTDWGLFFDFFLALDLERTSMVPVLCQTV